MNTIAFLQPADLSETLQLLNEYGNRARILAGGTDLVVGLRRGTIDPEAIIDISRLNILKNIDSNGDQIVIGSLVTHTQISQNENIKKRASMLADAAKLIGSWQIRNRGSIGGNIGNASPAADTLPPLFVLGADIQLMSHQGQRWIPIDEFFTGPGSTVRKPEELIMGIRFQTFTAPPKGFFKKIGQRRAVTISKVSAAGFLTFNGEVVEVCRLALGAVAPTVIRLHQAEKLIEGRQLNPALIEEASSLAGEVCTPITDIRSTVEYRCSMSKVLIKRGLISILEEING
jgi:carbon-monoxide dehydrogenase medium subunit